MKTLNKSLLRMMKGQENYPKIKIIGLLIVVSGVCFPLFFFVSITKEGLIFKYGEITNVCVIVLGIILVIYFLLDLYFNTREKSRMEVYLEIMKSPLSSENLKLKTLQLISEENKKNK